MIHITIRLYEELNDYLPENIRKSPFEIKIPDHTPLIKLLEILSIPEDEVDLILVNSKPAGLNRYLEAHDFISVYPEFESFNISNLQHIHKKPLRNTRFILRQNFSDLQDLLNKAGYDCKNGHKYSEEELIKVSYAEKRIILTSDKIFLHKFNISRGYNLKSKTPEKQFAEILKRFDLE